MRDINNAAAALFQLTDNGEQMIHLFFRQRRGWLIHNHNLGVVGESLGNFDHLHLRYR
ncbi:hypothetical protein D3C80_1843450 [compost metagenome]